jgi:hypothetical protein
MIDMIYRVWKLQYIHVSIFLKLIPFFEFCGNFTIFQKTCETSLRVKVSVNRTSIETSLQVFMFLVIFLCCPNCVPNLSQTGVYDLLLSQIQYLRLFLSDLLKEIIENHIKSYKKQVFPTFRAITFYFCLISTVEHRYNST